MIRSLVALPVLVVLLAVGTVAAELPMRGPLPDEQRELIHTMAAHHDSIERSVTLTKKGYTATTVSSDPEIARLIREHLSYMNKRMDSGAMVRRWDPAFVEMVRHHPDIVVKVKALDNGVRVKVSGKTPAAVAVAHNHAAIITGFVEEGMAELQRAHPAVLE